MSRLVDVDDPDVLDALGRQLAHWYWRGVAHGAVAALGMVILAVLVWAIVSPDVVFRIE